MGQGLFIPLLRDSIIIIRSRSVYTFGSRFTYKRWVRVFYQNLNFSFLGQVFQYFCWVSKCVDWGSQHIPIFLLGLKACLLRFTSFGIRAQVLKSVFYPFYLLFPFIILSCSFCVLYSLFLFCDALGQNRASSSKKKKRLQKRNRKQKKKYCS